MALVMCVPAVGTLLAVALLTVPALAARRWTDRVGPMTVLAAAFGALSGVIGLCLSAAWDIAAGGAIALSATGLFLVSVAGRSLPIGRPGRRPGGRQVKLPGVRLASGRS